MQDGVVEREGDVRRVKGDEAPDEVRVRVGLDVEDLGEDLEGGAGYILRVEDGRAREGRGVAGGQGAGVRWVRGGLVGSGEEGGGAAGGEEG